MNSTFLEANNITSLINTVRHNVNQEINYDITSEQKYINVLKKLVKTIHKANLNKNVSTEYMNNMVVNKCVPFLVNQIQKSNNEAKQDRQQIFSNLQLNQSARPVATRTFDKATELDSNTSSDQMDFSNLTLGNTPPNMQMSINTNTNTKPINTNTNNINNIVTPNFSEPLYPPNNNNQFNNMPSFEPPPPSIESDPQNMNFVNNLAGVNSKDVDENIDFAKRLEEMQREREYAANELQQKKVETQVLEARDSSIQQTNDKFFSKLAQNQQPSRESRDDSLNERSLELQAMNNGYQNNSNNGSNYLNDSASFDLGESVYSAYEQSGASNLIQLGDQNPSQSREKIIDFKNTVEDIQDSNKLEQSEQSEDIEALVKNRDKEVSKDASKEFIDNTFLSTNYQFAKRKRKVVCIDISDNLVDFTVNGSTIKAINNLSNSYWGRFKVNLSEDLIIDKLSDVFIESIIINNPAQANSFTNLYLVMDIEEFNIKTLSNNGTFSDKFILPNENTEASGSTKIMKYHLKSNYVATVNPTRLSSLTFNITNEAGDSVENTFTTYGVTSTNTVNTGAAAGGAITVGGINADGKFRILDAVFNSSNQFIGNIMATADNGDNNIKFLNATKFQLFAGETLYYPSGYTSNFLRAAANNGIVEIQVQSDPNGDFNVGDNVYLGTGIIIGKISSMDATVGAESITFEKAITKYIPNGARLYKSQPLPRVFASNEKSNRIILELVFMPR